MASQSLIELEGKFPERAVPLGLEALENYPYTWQAERALGQAVLNNRLKSILVGHQDRVRYAAWSPDSTHIATASYDGTAKIWNGQTGELLFTLSSHTDIVADVAWSPDGDKLATVSVDGSARIWDTSTGEELFTLLSHENEVYRAVWSPVENHLLTSGQDGTARIWDGDTGEELHTFLIESEVGNIRCELVAIRQSGCRKVISLAKLLSGMPKQARNYFLLMDIQILSIR